MTSDATPSEIPTSPDQEMPDPPTLEERLITAFGHLLDVKLDPLKSKVEALESALKLALTNFELAAHEFRRKSDAHDSQLADHEFRLRRAEEEVSRLREEIEILKAGGAQIRS